MLIRFDGKLLRRPQGGLASNRNCCCGGPCCPDRVLPSTIYGVIELQSADSECDCIDGIAVPFTKTIDDGITIEYRGSYDFEEDCPVPFLEIHTVAWILTCVQSVGEGEEGFWTLTMDDDVDRCDGDFAGGTGGTGVTTISCDPLELLTDNEGTLGGCCSEMALEEGRYKMRFLEALP